MIFLPATRAPLEIYHDRDEINFDFEQGDSAHRRAVSPSCTDQDSLGSKVLRSDRLAVCCALAALFSPRQGFQPNRWRESLPASQQIGNLGTWEVSRGAHLLKKKFTLLGVIEIEEYG